MNKKDIPVLVKESKNFNNKSNKNAIKFIKDISRIIIEIILELLFPNTCIFCEKFNNQDICPSCSEKYPYSKKPRCMNCGKFILDKERESCLQCSQKRFYFDQGASVWLHSGKVKEAIYGFKYKNRRVYGKTFARLMVENHRNKIISWNPECVIAIPVHPSRRKSRGYNQAEVLAIPVVKEIEGQTGVKIPYVKDLVIRRGSTSFQKLLDSKQRTNNLRGVFEVTQKYKIPQRVLIIDDIYTTGATINEVSKVLKKAGVKEVYFLTISIGQGF